MHLIDANRKRELLAHLVRKNDWEQVLVFTKTKHGANRLASQLQRDHINADAIHGNKSQNARIRALDDFKTGKVKVLVATDIAARGLDIEELPHVVNFDLPHIPEDYVHRIGRTGRAGASGEALSLVCGEDRPLLAAIERLINKKIEVRPVEGFEAGRLPQRQADAPQAPNAHHKAPAKPREEAPRRGRNQERREERAPRYRPTPRRRPRATRAAWTSTSPTNPRPRLRRDRSPNSRAAVNNSPSRPSSARRQPEPQGSKIP